MLALLFALVLCRSKANAVLNSTEESSDSQSVATRPPWNDTHVHLWNDAPRVNLTIQTAQAFAQHDNAGGDIVELDAEEDGSAQDNSVQATSVLLGSSSRRRWTRRRRGGRRRKSTRRRWTRRRRGGRRRKSSSDPCGGIDIAVCQTTDYLACIVGCLDIQSCEDDCEKTIVDPCYDQLYKACEAEALEVCEEAVKEAGAQSCEDICTEAAATAVAFSGGPEDPAGDAIAVVIEAGCFSSCETAVADDLVPGTDAFAEAVCKGIGF